MGSTVVGCHAAPPRLRRTGTGSLVGAYRTLSAVVRGREHDCCPAVDTSELLPSASPPGICTSEEAAHCVHTEVNAASSRSDIERGGFHKRNLQARDR